MKATGKKSTRHDTLQQHAVGAVQTGPPVFFAGFKDLTVRLKDPEGKTTFREFSRENIQRSTVRQLTVKALHSHGVSAVVKLASPMVTCVTSELRSSLAAPPQQRESTDDPSKASHTCRERRYKR
ncbi:unnamed protein product [Pleuronectes platessa]|uniref:Uncharacterized protein n=1 Tax=Pleuronectes platessa TaxID=8262 RepID=A0A9N7YY68_PLEPL|nr:unnamed protein product [Pleuronectes platessa]